MKFKSFMCVAFVFMFIGCNNIPIPIAIRGPLYSPVKKKTINKDDAIDKDGKKTDTKESK